MRSISTQTLAALAALLVLAACSSGVAPNGALDGTWQTANLTTDGGIEIDIKQRGTSVTGTGQTLDATQSVTASYTIRGSYQNAAINLSMSYTGGGSGKFTGRLIGTNVIQGTWTPPAPDTASVITLLR